MQRYVFGACCADLGQKQRIKDANTVSLSLSKKKHQLFPLFPHFTLLSKL